MADGVRTHDAGDHQLLRSWAAYARSGYILSFLFSISSYRLIDSKILVYSLISTDLKAGEFCCREHFATCRLEQF